MKYLGLLILPFLISSIISTDLTTVSCSNDNDCEEYHAECKLGKCACPANYVLGDYKKKCYPIVTEYDCSTNDDCEDFNANCESGKCVCNENTKLNYDKTHCELIFKNITCEDDADCALMETNCISGKCECANDYAFNFDATKCLKKLSSITCSSKIDSEEFPCPKILVYADELKLLPVFLLTFATNKSSSDKVESGSIVGSW